MRHLSIVLALSLLSGCTALEARRVWSTSWAAVGETPMLAACTPWNALWELILIGPRRFRKDALIVEIWGHWLDRVTGKESTWSAPLALVPVVPLLTILQPATGYLHLAGRGQGG